MRIKFRHLLLITILFSTHSQAKDDLAATTSAIMSHIEALAGDSGIGPRVAGSEEEIQAANYILQQFKDAGLDAELQPFEAVFRGQKKAQASQNVIATIKGDSTKTFIIGGHYDSVPAATGSMGVIDNAASIALMIELAKHIQGLDKRALNFTFLAFGAEEVGLTGAKYYVSQLSQQQRSNVVGMLNLDSITGGDNLYVHSANTSGYDCDGDKSAFLATPKWRDRFLALSQTNGLSFAKHPGNEAYPAGETGGWSDHAPFACAGIPIVNLEATNFALLGENGKDGYSQTENPKLWDCYDAETMGTCNRDDEKKWGKIWHTEFDRLNILEEEFPERLEYQLGQSYLLLTAFFDNSQAILD